MLTETPNENAATPSRNRMVSAISPAAVETGRDPGPAARHSPSEAFMATLSIFAHDLRGPLANLSLLLEGMETVAASRGVASLAEQARKSQATVQALDDLLTAMLDRTRRTGDPLGVRPQRLDLDEVIQAATGLSLPLARARDVRIRRSGARGAALLGDRGLVVQALDNLVGNAVKHAPEGTVVSVAVTALADELVIRVSNSGPALTEDDLARAFRPFTRLSTVADARRASFGLGLWIVRLIAERHGGAVRAAPRRDGSGAEFSLHLPRTT